MRDDARVCEGGIPAIEGSPGEDGDEWQGGLVEEGGEGGRGGPSGGYVAHSGVQLGGLVGAPAAPRIDDCPCAASAHHGEGTANAQGLGVKLHQVGWEADKRGVALEHGGDRLAREVHAIRQDPQRAVWVVVGVLLTEVIPA